MHYGSLLLDDHLLDLAGAKAGKDRVNVVTAKQDRLEEIGAALAPSIVEELAGRWLDLRLAEIAADSMRVECLGRDLMHPDMRAKLAKSKSRLLALKESLKVWAEFELPEPQDAEVHRLLTLLEREAEE